MDGRKIFPAKNIGSLEVTFRRPRGPNAPYLHQDNPGGVVFAT